MTEVFQSELKYQPTDAERAALDRQAQRRKEQPVAPRLKVVADYRGVRVVYDHPDEVVAHSLLKDSLGTVDDDFCLGLLDQLYEFVGLEDSARCETELNFLLSMIINEKPKDQLETMLLFQMGVTSLVQMRTAQNFRRIQADSLRIMRDLPEKNPFVIRELVSLTKNLSLLQDSNERSFNRFARTNCMQLETLGRHRRNGEPSMTVRQLTVAQGGRAILGNFTHATPQTAPNNQAAGPRALTDQQHSAMPIIGEPDRVAVPVRRWKKSNDEQPSA
jgi:hypothetical protein